jgi:hypothetical protein
MSHLISHFTTIITNASTAAAAATTTTTNTTYTITTTTKTLLFFFESLSSTVRSDILYLRWLLCFYCIWYKALKSP